ncbi:MAG TPA: carotenoid biosynthesis protein [Bacteroidales bacterium]|nr:carotenoid biosynthesis protein [Bacteroidales bacterium]
MERKSFINNKSVSIILYVMYGVGVLGHSLQYSRELMLTLTPFTLLFTGGLVIYILMNDNNEIGKWLIVTYLITYSLELIGVKSGAIFGNYHYGNVLGPKIFETPIIIGLNWILVILGALVITKKFINKSPAFIIIFAPLLAVTFDFVLEPVAVKLNYWSWDGGVIPFQNYVAWYIIAFIFSAYFVLLKIEIKSKLAANYFLIQFVFFIILNLVL